jgi:hypothetical protein
MLHKFILISLLLLNSFALANDGKKIDFLLNEIKNSNHIFIRNGEEHTSQQAYEHIKFKLGYVKKAFFFFGPEKDIPIKDFVEKIASSSSSTNKPYYIKGKNMKKTPVKEWLYKKLKEFENISKSKLVRKKDQKL